MQSLICAHVGFVLLSPDKGRKVLVEQLFDDLTVWEKTAHADVDI